MERFSNLPRATELGSGGAGPGLGPVGQESVRWGVPGLEPDFSGRSHCRCGNKVGAVAGLGGLLASGAGDRREEEDAGSCERRNGRKPKSGVRGVSSHTPGHQ